MAAAEIVKLCYFCCRGVESAVKNRDTARIGFCKDTIMLNILIRTGLVLLVPLLALSPAGASDMLEKFYGQYEGEVPHEVAGKTPQRSLNVFIRPYKRGFTVEWTTTIKKPSGKVKVANYSINFKSVGKNGLYRSAMKTNAFGHEVPLDPLKGEPYVWAVLAGKTITVHSMMIFRNGDYEIQTYIRTLTDDGLDVVFLRIRNGIKKKDLRARLKRVK